MQYCQLLMLYPQTVSRDFQLHIYIVQCRTYSYMYNVHVVFMRSENFKSCMHLQKDFFAIIGLGRALKQDSVLTK